VKIYLMITFVKITKIDVTSLVFVGKRCGLKHMIYKNRSDYCLYRMSSLEKNKRKGKKQSKHVIDYQMVCLLYCLMFTELSHYSPYKSNN